MEYEFGKMLTKTFIHMKMYIQWVFTYILGGSRHTMHVNRRLYLETTKTFDILYVDNQGKGMPNILMINLFQKVISS